MVLPALVARGPFVAAMFGAAALAFYGEFWNHVGRAEVECGGEQTNAMECYDAIAGSVMMGILCLTTSFYVAWALAMPVPKIRSIEDTRHHWLSSEFTHVAYTHPDGRGYQRVLYLNHPTTPSKIRFNIADPGTHSSKLMIRDTEDLSRWPKRQQGANGDFFVDFSRDDEMPLQFNDFKPTDALDLGNTLSSHMLNYLATNNLNGSCFLAQYPSSGGIRSAIVKIMPSASQDDGDFPALECGTDIQAFDINIPMY